MKAPFELPDFRFHDRLKLTVLAGHKRTTGGQEGSKKCVSEIYECPVRPWVFRFRLSL